MGGERSIRRRVVQHRIQSSSDRRSGGQTGKHRTIPDAAFQQEGQRTFGCLRAMSSEAITAGNLRPEIKDSEELAQALWVSIHGMVSAQIGCPGFPWVESSRLTDRLLDVLMTGIEKL